MTEKMREDVYFFLGAYQAATSCRLRDDLRKEITRTSTNSAASCSERSVRTDVPLNQLIDAQPLNQLVNVPVVSVAPQSVFTEPSDLLTNYTTPVRTEHMINFVEIKSGAGCVCVLNASDSPF